MIQNLKIKNSYNYILTLIIEPWGREFEIENGKSVIIEVDYEINGFPEIEFSEKYIVVYLWSTCSVLLKDESGNMIENGNMIQRSL